MKVSNQMSTVDYYVRLLLAAPRSHTHSILQRVHPLETIAVCVAVKITVNKYPLTRTRAADQCCSLFAVVHALLVFCLTFEWYLPEYLIGMGAISTQKHNCDKYN